MSPKGRDRQRLDRRIALWMLACSFIFFSLFTHGVLSGSDELGVFEVTRSLYERGELVVPPGHHVFQSQRDQRLYNHFAIGQSVLALPFYALGRAGEMLLPEGWTRAMAGPRIGRYPYVFGGTVTHWAVTFYAPFASALLVALFFLCERSLGALPRSAALAALLLAGCTYLGTMATGFLRHTTEAVALLGAFLGFHAYARDGRSMHLALGSALGAATLLVRVPALVGAPALIAFAGWAILQRWRRDRGRVWLSALCATALPAAAAITIHLVVNYWKWGTWLESPMLSQRGHFTLPLHVGLAGFLLSPGCSLFVYSPLLLLLPRTMPVLWVRERAACLLMLGLSLSFLLVCAKFKAWHGLWSAPGPRYLFVLVPFLMLPLGPWLDTRRRGADRIALVVLAALGALVQWLSMTTWFPAVVDLMAWPPLGDVTPGFLFSPAEAPLVGSARRILESGRLDTWLWGLGVGFPGRRGTPLVALGLLVAWLGLLTLAVRGALGALRAAEEAEPRPDGPGAASTAGRAAHG